MRLVALLLIIVAYSSCLSIQVVKCTGSPTPTLSPFSNTVTGEPQAGTSAHMCHDGKFLNIYWWCDDYEIISDYQKCNDPLYNQDAVEIFLASVSSAPHTYYEF